MATGIRAVIDARTCVKYEVNPATYREALLQLNEFKGAEVEVDYASIPQDADYHVQSAISHLTYLGSEADSFLLSAAARQVFQHLRSTAK